MSKQKLQQAQSHASTVMELLRRNAVPPVPRFYQLFYDYLSGVRPLTSARLDAILRGSRETGEPVHALLYDEFVRPYEAEDLVDRTAERLEVLSDLIGATGTANRSHSQSLEAIGTDLAGGDLRTGPLRDLIVRLEAANQTWLLENRVLVAKLEAARDEAEATRSELVQLQRESLIDPVTALANRDGLERALSVAFVDAETEDRRFAVAMIDVDHFKSLNDNFGHQAGDNILRLVGRALLVTLPTDGVVGRFGGDEFVAILRDVDNSSAEIMAERLRQSVADIDLSKCVGRDIIGGLTASIGLTPFRKGDTVSSLFDRADRCLYEAKRLGRNRYRSSESLPENCGASIVSGSRDS